MVVLAARNSACLLCPCMQFLLHCLISKAKGNTIYYLWKWLCEHDIWRGKWTNEWVWILCALWNDNVRFQDVTFSKDDLRLPAWTESQTVYTVHHITEAQGICVCILSALRLILFSTHVNTVGTQHWLCRDQFETCVVVPVSAHISFI